MKFFTRELYQANQAPSGTQAHRAVRKRWKRTVRAYISHMQELEPKLPSSAKPLMTTPFHDGRICKLDQDIAARTISVVINCQSNPWGPRGLFELKLKNVHSSEISSSVVGDCWVYEEVHSNSTDTFEYHVLLEHNEFMIVAETVQINQHDNSNRV